MKKRAKFNLSNFHNCTFKMGDLYPTNLMEVLPGDTVQLNSSVFMRLAPMVAPVMHPVHMFMHHFFIPSRVISNWLCDRSIPGNSCKFNFESFITGGEDGMNISVLPNFTINEKSYLADAFGLPIHMLGTSKRLNVNLLPLAAYYMIYNEYYRDQDLQDRYGFSLPGNTWQFGKYRPNVSFSQQSDLPILHPCWSKDYFTTSRPWPQKGPQVTIPIDLSAGSDPSLAFSGSLANTSITGVPTFTGSVSPSAAGEVWVRAGKLGTQDQNGEFQAFADSSGMSLSNGTVNGTVTYSPGTLGNGSISVDDVRQAFALQRFEEHRALFGNRYEDYLRYLGVRPQDSRLQMPEYLGGFTSPVQFSEVIQTGGDAGGIGDLYGHGIAAARGRRVRRFIPEHGYIMSLLCVRPIPVYAQGVERLWSKTTKEDFWQKELEHIGQQEILNKEVYADGTDGDGNTFGFQNRYDEYRRGVNVVTGEFRTNQDFWTMARIFNNRPALNADFVECNPTDRIFQVNSNNSDQCYCMVKNNVIARRLISKNGNPI